MGFHKCNVGFLAGYSKKCAGAFNFKNPKSSVAIAKCALINIVMVPQERCIFFKNKKKKKLSPACCHYVIGLILFSLCITTASPPDFIQWSSSFLIMEPRYSKYYVIFNFLLLIVHDGFKFQENYTSSMWKETGFTVIFKRCFVGGVICISEFWIFINCGLIEIVSSHQVSSFSFSPMVFNRYSGKSWCSHLIPCAPQIKCSPTNRTTTCCSWCV